MDYTIKNTHQKRIATTTKTRVHNTLVSKMCVLIDMKGLEIVDIVSISLGT